MLFISFLNECLIYLCFNKIRWPVILSGLPGGIHWVRLLFLFLILLGVDSAFSFQEAVLTCLRDTVVLKESAKWKVAMVITLACFAIGLLYATDAGLFYLDTIDFYINFIMLFIGFIECFSVGKLTVMIFYLNMVCFLGDFNINNTFLVQQVGSGELKTRLKNMAQELSSPTCLQISGPF